MINRIMNFFRRLFPVKTEGYGETSGEINIGLIIGHDQKAQGAVSFDGTSEYLYNSKVASLTGITHTNRNNGGIAGAVKELKRLGFNSSCEMHLNAYNGKAKGFEILVLKGDLESIRHARLVAETFKSKFPDHVMRGDNGLKLISNKDRGGGNLQTAKNHGMKVAILMEPFFCDNKADYIPAQLLADFYKEALK